eukprot:scaffold6219_cov48-Phaeocystis_antarctica.AAC.2
MQPKALHRRCGRPGPQPFAGGGAFISHFCRGSRTERRGGGAHLNRVVEQVPLPVAILVPDPVLAGVLAALVAAVLGDRAGEPRAVAIPPHGDRRTHQTLATERLRHPATRSSERAPCWRRFIMGVTHHTSHKVPIYNWVPWGCAPPPAPRSDTQGAAGKELLARSSCSRPLNAEAIGKRSGHN